MNGESPTTETKSGDITGKLVDAVKANDDPMSQKHPEAPAGLVFFFLSRYFDLDNCRRFTGCTLLESLDCEGRTFESRYNEAPES